VLELAPSTFYDWARRYRQEGFRGLVGLPYPAVVPLNKLLQEERDQIIATAKALPLEGHRKVAAYVAREGVYVSASTAYRVMKAAEILPNRKIRRRTAGERYVTEPAKPNELWATDIHYMFVEGHGFYYLFTVLDAYSRYVVHWELRPTMTAEDGCAVVREALVKMKITREHGLRLLHDNGTQFLSKTFQRMLRERGVQSVRTAYRHPETNGRLERYHLTINAATVDLMQFTTPTMARQKVEAFVYEYNTQRPHESLGDVPPAAAYFGYADELRRRRHENHQAAQERRRRVNQEANLALAN
jgi:putative transposase